MWRMEIIPEVAELFKMMVIAGSLIFMAMIFSVLIGQLMYGLFDG